MKLPLDLLCTPFPLSTVDRLFVTEAEEVKVGG